MSEPTHSTHHHNVNSGVYRGQVLSKMASALQFYATNLFRRLSNNEPCIQTPIEHDCGDKAREALAAFKELVDQAPSKRSITDVFLDGGMPVTEVMFNINNKVTVTLTKVGAEILNKQRVLELNLHNITPRDPVKAGDQFTEQLYVVMHIFGPSMPGIGGDEPFTDMVMQLKVSDLHHVK